MSYGHNNRVTELLARLHEATAETLLDYLEHGTPSPTADDPDVRTPISAATLSVIIRFLKDNGIEADRLPGSPMADLADKLADFKDTLDDV